MFFINTGRVFRTTISKKLEQDGQVYGELETRDQFVVRFGDKFVCAEFLGNYASYREIASYVGKDGKVKEDKVFFLSTKECNSEGEYIKEIKPFSFDRTRVSNRALISMQRDFTGLGPKKTVLVTPIQDKTQERVTSEKTNETENAATVVRTPYNPVGKLHDAVNSKLQGGYSDLTNIFH